jgi:serine/threonine kinase 38
MIKEIPFETLLKNKRINQKTYEKVKIAKEYIERKYNLKTIKDSKYNAILEKLNSEDLSDEAKKKILSELQHQETEELRKARQRQTIRDYESLTIIGRGAFGEVHVCREIKTGKIVAIKKIKKDLLEKKNQIIHIRNEQLFMSKVKSPWIVELKASFQEDDFLYLVMEFLPGGDFMNLLIEKDKLTEEEAKFYTAEVILAVESIHKLDCVHRDIKPDNILIDKNGHIKLSDFGLAKVSDKLYETNTIKDENFNPKKMTHKKLYSCVGTAYYVAPEVLNKKGYGQEIDWWSVGVIFYEMLVGYAPFCAEDTRTVCGNILNHKETLKIPPEITLSKEATDLIYRMIDDPNKRLGKNGADEIKAHPFFKGVDWDHIRETMKPPFIPEIKNDYDTKYFETFEKIEPFYPPTKKMPRRKDMEYIGFTYKEEEEEDLNNVVNNMIKKLKGENDNNGKSE